MTVRAVDTANTLTFQEGKSNAKPRNVWLTRAGTQNKSHARLFNFISFLIAASADPGIVMRSRIQIPSRIG